MISSTEVREDLGMCRYYTDLHERLITDIAAQYGTPAVKLESTRDVAVMRRRVRSEGLSFLTKSLPKLGKELDKALSQATTFAPRGFKLRPRSQLPKLFGWLFERVFSDNGQELSHACPRAVRDLRQLLYVMYKLAVPYTCEQEMTVISDFVSTDEELPTSIAEDAVLKYARWFTTNVFGSFDPYDIVPKHGPGAVATGEKSWEKHRFSRLYRSIESEYPFTEYFVYGMDQLCLHPSYVSSLEELDSGTAKVVLVPKDSRGPRLISCEPLEYQWIQGGLGGKVKTHLETNRWTRGHVNFTDQTINQRFAVQGSKGSGHVTLDMKEASDRVSLALVEFLFADCPRLLACLKACRTPQTRLPCGRLVSMKKFAPMGSNLCFPVEAFVFMALGVGVILDGWLKNARPIPAKVPAGNARRVKRLMFRASRRLYVYGDDIISNREDYAALLQYFPTVGLKFNADKCCTQGSFRESCGVDAFKGVDVTPLRLKKVWMSSRYQDPATYCSYVSFSNEAYSRGYHSSASFVSEACEGDLGCLPVLPELPRGDSRCIQQYSVLAWIRPYSPTSPSASYLRNFRFQESKDPRRPNLQRREVRVLQAVARRVTVPSDDWCLVLRRLTTPTKLDDPGVFTRSRSVTLKRVWLPY